MNGVADSGVMEIPAARKIFAVSTAPERWRKVNVTELLPLVRAGARFVDGAERIPRNAVAEKMKTPLDSRGHHVAITLRSISRSAPCA